VFVWFEKGGDFLRYEARDLSNGRYELRIIDADGTERTETFSDSTALNKRQIDLERELAANGWTGPHGWNL
ncbi:MAG TPA: hypothetical protein VG222_10200, partial [Vicinamibacterales bacterium]|nr:hypothetical protein [Vicinamibacterales bacterium]